MSSNGATCTRPLQAWRDGRPFRVHQTWFEIVKFILPFLVLLYVVFPLDLFPDVIVGLGWIDDLILLFLLWWYFFVYRKQKYPGRGPSDHDKESAFSQSVEDEGTSPYDVLGLPRNATQEDIKTAYRNLVKQYHPDKVNHLGEEFSALAEKRFKEIQQAYQTLNAE